MKKIKQKAIELWRDESAQGMLEYVLLAVGLMIAVIAFRKKFAGWIDGATQRGDTEMGQAFE